MKVISKQNLRWLGAIAAMCLLGNAITMLTQAQSAATLPSGVQDVVKLVKAGLGEPVVLAHIKNTGAFYKLSADQIIYLHDQGVSQNEITALMGDTAGTGSGAPTSAAPVPTTAPTVPPPQYATPPAAPPMEPAASAPTAQVPTTERFPGATVALWLLDGSPRLRALLASSCDGPRSVVETLCRPGLLDIHGRGVVLAVGVSVGQHRIPLRALVPRCVRLGLGPWIRLGACLGLLAPG